MHGSLIFTFACLALALPVLGEGLTISGGLDGRASHSSETDADAELRGLFLNLRQVWQDDEGDRWIGVAQLDVEHDFAEVQPYQAYLQYKGPLGKWNIRGGHFLVPFGLLATYDTERLLLGGLEDLNLGIRHDTGIEWLGRFGTWDYALAVTDGLGVTSLFDSRANPVVSGRVAYVRDDWQLGLSVFSGRVVFAEERDFGWNDAQLRLAALDFTRSWGPATVRAEVTAGTEGGRGVWGGVLLGDYALTERLELNTRAAFRHGAHDRTFVGAGLSYRLADGLFVRIADEIEFGKHENNTLTGQLYFEFSRRF